MIITINLPQFLCFMILSFGLGTNIGMFLISMHDFKNEEG